MSAQRPGTGRSLLFVNALLLSTALAGPAMAQVETVIVTAQHKAENIQTVPIAVSAFTSQDLAAHQIENAKDLQFAIPNVTFTHGNFGPSNFQIRGIGSAAVTTSGDSGVAVDLDEIYLANPPLTSGIYYDTDSIQVQRGAQSTLWGRNATGGVIDQETTKPDLDSFGGYVEGTYGNYNDEELRAAVNVPLDEGKFAIRGAAFWERRDGDITNVFNAVNGNTPGVANHVDSRNDYSVRLSARWEPSSSTSFDFMVQYGNEDDTRVRAQVQLCHRDPSGVLGCLPDAANAEPLNGNATLATLLASNLGLLGNLQNLGFGGAFAPLNNFFTLFPVTGPGSTPGMGSTAIVPHSLTAINTDFTPTTQGRDLFAYMHWKQNVNSWLNSDFLIGFDNNAGVGRESYNNAPGDLFSIYPENATQAFLLGSGLSSLVASQELFCGTFPGQNCNVLVGRGFGLLPESGVGNNGQIGGNIRGYFNRIEADDQISGKDRNWSAEERFSTSFGGPLNGIFGLYYLNYYNNAQYFVNANTLDYFGNILGGLFTNGNGVFGPTQYDNNNADYLLQSEAAYGELTYDVVPDLFKLIGGLRYSHDDKTFVSRQSLFNTVEPWGCGDLCNANALSASGLPFLHQEATFDSLTGRFVAQYSPTLDFTDKTMIYASYSKGYRAGGFNPPSFLNPSANNTFAPEKVDDYEVGTKNTLLGGVLQADLTAFYYNYKGYQISEIVNRTSVNLNINSKLWGVEGEFFYAPTDAFLLNANFGYENSRLVNTSLVDTRNPTASQPNATLVKDAGNGANCVVTNDPGFASFEAAGLVNANGQPLAVAPPVPTPGVFASAFAPAGIGVFSPLGGGLNFCAMTDPEFQALLGLYDPGAAGHYHLSSGIAENLSGNQMPLTPPWTFNIGAQYTFDLPSSYTLVPRVDFYWKDNMWGRIFEDGADRINSWSVTNAQIQLNAPEVWYARFWMANVFDQHNITGEYVTDPTSALFTNAFVEAPRTYGITLGVKF